MAVDDPRRRAPGAPVPADVPRVALLVVPAARSCSCRRWASGSGRTSTESGNATQALGGLTLPRSSSRPGCSRRRRCRRRPSSRPSRSWAGSPGSGPSTRCIATPITPRDIVLGNVAWIAFRLTMIAAIFTIVMALFGAAASPLIVLAIPAAVLTGLAFATPIAAFSATQRTPETVQRDLPVRDHAAVPVLGHVLPDLEPAAAAPADRLAVAAVARRRADPRPRPRDDRPGAAPRARPRRGPRGDHWSLGLGLGVPDGRSPAGARMSGIGRATVRRDRSPLGCAAVRASAAAGRASSSSATSTSTATTGSCIVSGFFEPLFYLASIGFGLGALVGTVPGPGGQPISYQLVRRAGPARDAPR